MKLDSAGHPLFIASAKTHLLIDSIPLNFGGSSGPTHFLTVRSLYDIGNLSLNSGAEIQAYRIRSGPTVVQLVDNQTGWGMETLPLHSAMALLRLQPGEIIPGSNCHGYTFAQSGYWIEEDVIDLLLEQESYRAVDRAEASVAVFRDKGRAVHSCLIYPSDSGVRYKGKAGIGAILETGDDHEAARGNSYTTVDYYCPAQTAPRARERNECAVRGTSVAM